LIGTQFEGFREAEELVALGGVLSVANAGELSEKLDTLMENEELRQSTGHINSDYIEQNLGATGRIMDYLKSLLDSPKS
ncbi:MAG: 3-deoxy-D-manno-octulosonic acid transferase, partial [Eudoraea sp.]|nr:3-deoxy-D-manno-octulosonic acid transferase [Eudoraea sp.]